MTFPIEKDKFVEAYLKIVGEYDELDAEYASSLAAVINRAYYEGLEDGREEAAACKE